MEKERKDISEKYKWDLSPLCKDDDEFYQKLKEFKAFLPQIIAFEGKLCTKDKILEFLKLDEEVTKLIEPAIEYSYLKRDECLDNEKYNEMSEKLSTILNEYSIETSFASSELHELDDSLLDEIIKDKDFKDYDRMFKDIKRSKKHKLSKGEEKLLAGMDFLDGYSDNMRNIADLDLKFGSVKDERGKRYVLNQSNYGKLMRSNDRTLRKATFERLNGKFGEMINTLASNYINEVKANCYFAKIRKYDSALGAALFNEEVEPDVYYTLVKMVHENLDLLFDYFKLKQKKMGLKDFYIYDAMASTDVGSEKKYSYDEAIEIIKKALSPLGEEYVNLLQRAKDERWIDVFHNRGKRSGAYESGIYGFHPYVLTNFEGDLDSIFTLAHELGHAMHSYFSNKNQPMPKANYTIFLAEIASTTNEILLLNYLLKNSKDKNEKDSLYNKLFEEVKSTIFRQTMFAEFEEGVHRMQQEGEGLTKDKICNFYYSLNEKYFGHVKLIDEIKYEWARIPHFFTAFYVYKYATGMISAITFAQRILSGDENARKDYFKFLSAGDSDAPCSILRKSGCDLENKETFNECFKYLKNMLKNWEKLD